MINTPGRWLSGALAGCWLLAAGAAEPPRAAAAGQDWTALAETAERTGDLDGAVGFLQRAREGATADAWRTASLHLADLLIRAGKPQEAQRVLAEIAARDPDRDHTERRVLEGRALSAAGSLPAALKLLNELASTAGLSREQLDQVLTALAEAYLRAGNFPLAADTYDRLAKLSSDPEVEFQAWCGRVYARQLGGRLAESGADLKADGAKYRAEAVRRETVERLELMQLMLERKNTEFRTRYTAFRKNRKPAPDALLYQAARGFAGHLEAGGMPGDAIAFYRDAVDYADSDRERQASLRLLARAQQAANLPEAAAATLGRFLEFYPSAPDRGELLMRIGRLQAAARHPAEAIQVLERITADNTLAARLGREAAREAATIAANAGLNAAAERNFRYLIDRAATAEERQEGYFLLGEFEFRRRQFGRAAEAFGTAAAEAGERRETARFWQLQSLIKAELYAAARPVAEQLRTARDPALRAAADYFLALLLDRTGQAEAARTAYLAFAAAHPESEFAAPARFDAARIADERRDYAAAARLYAEFAEAFPQHKLAPNALFKSMQAAFLAPDDARMQIAADQLATRYPESEFTVAALFRLTDYLCGDNRYPAALAVLERLRALAAKQPAILAQTLLDEARIRRRLNDSERALAALRTLLEKYPDSEVAPDAALLAGNLYSDLGRYDEAAAACDRALKLRPAGAFGDVCREHRADALLGAYAANHDRKLLDEAAGIYRTLADRRDPASLYSALYKLGRCRELAGDPPAAVQLYREVLYRTVNARRAGEAPESLWAGKAVYAATLLLLKQGSPETAREALRILELAGHLELHSGDDFAAMAAQIRRKYKIQ